MRRRFASLLLAAMLTLTAVAEDLGEPIPEVEPAAEEIYEETKMATESEDPEEDDAGTEETISAAETIAEDVETTEEVSESGEVDEKVETDSGDGTVYSETGTDDTELETVGSDDTDCGTDNGGSETEDEIQELGRDVSSEETEGVIGDSDLAGAEGDAELDGGRDTVYGDAEVTESEIEEEVIVVESEPIVIESEAIVIGETESEVVEEPEVIEESEVIEEEPIMMAPMMVGVSFLGATKADATGKCSIKSGGYDGMTIYAGQTGTITFTVDSDDKLFQYGYKVGNGSWNGWSGRSELATAYSKWSYEDGTFTISYSDIYDKMNSDGECKVIIHVHQNKGLNVYGVETTFTFYKFSIGEPKISISADKYEVYPGDYVILTATWSVETNGKVIDTSFDWYIDGELYTEDGHGSVISYPAKEKSFEVYAVLKISY